MKTLVLGLTGSIGMGKTVATEIFRHSGIPVFAADEVVHRLLSPTGEAALIVRKSFPQAVRNETIDRKDLGNKVFQKPEYLQQLEGILHPLVQKQKARFVSKAQRRRQAFVVLDIPLLFETGGETHCDYVAVVTAPPFVQRSRVMSRDGMTEIKYVRILEKQIPDVIKRRRADFIIFSGLGRAVTYRSIMKLSRLLRKKALER